MASAASPTNNDNDELQNALKVLDDVGRAGLALVPLEPTAAMITAGMQIGEITEAQVMAIYFAMLSTAAAE